MGVKTELPKRTTTVRFTSGLKFNDKQQLYRPIHTDLPQYVGAVGPEIESAWKEIVGGMFINFTTQYLVSQ